MYEEIDAQYKLVRHNRKQEFKKWYLNLKKGLKCFHCPEDFPDCLDFHHVDPKTKWKKGIHSAVRSYSKRRVVEEMAKCIVLCANCHRKLEAKILKERSGIYNYMSGTELTITKSGMIGDTWDGISQGSLLDTPFVSATPIEATPAPAGC